VLRDSRGACRIEIGRQWLGLASGNLESGGWLKVEAAGLREFVSFGCFSDFDKSQVDTFRQGMTEVQLRLGESAQVYFIGDTPEDIKAAGCANSQIVALCTGIFKVDELAGYEPDACVASRAELLAKIARE
jgi:phosphoglycolate phosphatase